jgi:hypothetical protein
LPSVNERLQTSETGPGGESSLGLRSSYFAYKLNNATPTTSSESSQLPRAPAGHSGPHTRSLGRQRCPRQSSNRHQGDEERRRCEWRRRLGRRRQGEQSNVLKRMLGSADMGEGLLGAGRSVNTGVGSRRLTGADLKAWGQATSEYLPYLYAILACVEADDLLLKSDPGKLPVLAVVVSRSLTTSRQSLPGAPLSPLSL